VNTFQQPAVSFFFSVEAFHTLSTSAKRQRY
jgi:hypothetical protein